MDLLTGATGLLGERLAGRLESDGRRLRALVRPGTDLRRIPRQIEEVVWGGLDEMDALGRATEGIDTVFHAAARVSGGGGRASFAADNVTGTEALLAAAREAGVRRFVHVSSAGIYGPGHKGAPIDETTPLDPEIERRGAYAWSKAEADRRVRAFVAAGGMEAIVIRPGIIYGGQKPFIARLHFRLPGRGDRCLIVGGRKTLIPLTHVDNASAAIALAATRGRPGAAYNVVDGHITQGDYLDLVLNSGVFSLKPVFLRSTWLIPAALACELASRMTGWSLPLSRYRLRRATESLAYDTHAAREELGWTPEVDLAAGVRSLGCGDGSEQRAAA